MLTLPTAKITVSSFYFISLDEASLMYYINKWPCVCLSRTQSAFIINFFSSKVSLLCESDSNTSDKPVSLWLKSKFDFKEL